MLIDCCLFGVRFASPRSFGLMRTARHLTHFKPSFDPFHLVIPTFLRGKMNGITAIVEFTWFTSQRLDCG